MRITTPYACTLIMSVALVSAGCAHHAPGGAASAEDQQVRELMEVTGDLRLQRGSVDDMVAQLEQSGEYPAAFLARLRDLVATEDLASALIPIYERHLDARTIEGSVAFWASPSGRAFIASEAVVLGDYQQAANEWTAAVSTCAATEETASGAAPVSVQAPASGPAAKALELLELRGGAATDRQILDAALAAIDKSTDFPPGFRDRFKRCAHRDDFLNHIAPVFAKHLDEPTLDAVVAYYRSDAGRASSAAQAALDEDVPKATAKWTAALIRRANKETRH